MTGRDCRACRPHAERHPRYRCAVLIRRRAGNSLTDTPPELPLHVGLRVLVTDALRHRPHPAHFSLDEAVEVVERLQPEQAYLTHISHDMDHETLCQTLPRRIQPAYDGLTFDF